MSKFKNSRNPVRGLSVTVDRDFGRALKTFSKKVQESGKLKEVRDRMYYESPSEKKQRRRKMAKKRWQKKIESMTESGRWVNREKARRKF